MEINKFLSKLIDADCKIINLAFNENKKEFIDLINTLISGATKLVDTFGSIPTVAGILGGFAAIKNVGRPKMFGLRLLF